MMSPMEARTVAFGKRRMSFFIGVLQNELGCKGVSYIDPPPQKKRGGGSGRGRSLTILVRQLRSIWEGVNIEVRTGNQIICTSFQLDGLLMVVKV